MLCSVHRLLQMFSNVDIKVKDSWLEFCDKSEWFMIEILKDSWLESLEKCERYVIVKFK